MITGPPPKFHGPRDILARIPGRDSAPLCSHIEQNAMHICMCAVFVFFEEGEYPRMGLSLQKRQTFMRAVKYRLFAGWSDLPIHPLWPDDSGEEPVWGSYGRMQQAVC